MALMENDLDQLGWERQSYHSRSGRKELLPGVTGLTYGSIRSPVTPLLFVGVGRDDKTEMEFGGETGAFENTEAGIQ